MQNEPAPIIIGRRKFFSFFWTGVVMAAAPKLFLSPIDYRTQPLDYIEMYGAPGYGKGLSEAIAFMEYLDEMTRKIILGEIRVR